MKKSFYWLAAMSKLKMFTLLGTIFCAATLSVLMLWPDSISAKEGGVGRIVSSTAAEPSNANGGNPAARRAASAPQNTEFAGQGLIYAPRDVVDMARLVLEASRDHTSHLAHYIERATSIIVVFFTLFGAAGAVFGISRLNDIERKANDHMAKFEAGIAASQQEVAQLEASHKESLLSAAGILTRRVTNQADATLARLNIQLCKNPSLGDEQKNRLLQQVCDALDGVLADVSESGLFGITKVRAFADLAYARKRLGQIELAHRAITQAIDLGRIDCKEALGANGLGLLVFNAACYYSIMKNFPASVRHLEEAVSLNPRFKEAAVKDEDLNELKRAEPDEFAKIVK